jgi:hypothetical protein
MIVSQGILYIEPSNNTSTEPLIDELTRKMTAAFRRGVPGVRYKGFHICKCGVRSDNTDYTLANGQQTHLLCIHYLAYHRDEIPFFQLEKVAALDCGEAEPTKEELKSPKRRPFTI